MQRAADDLIIAKAGDPKADGGVDMMTAVSTESMTSSSAITRPANSPATGKAIVRNFHPSFPPPNVGFGLMDADATEALLLAGEFSVCSRAFEFAHVHRLRNSKIEAG